MICRKKQHLLLELPSPDAIIFRRSTIANKDD